jgi:hypothetical protein
MRVRGLEELDGHLVDGLTFCTLAYAAFDKVRARLNGIEDLRMRRTPRSKKLIEEILPLARYVQRRYGPGLRIEVRWKGGNQTHDAFIRCSGADIEHRGVPRRQFLEVTTAVHPNEYLTREQLNAEGFSWGPRLARRDRKTRRVLSEPAVNEYREAENEHIEQILDVIRVKQAKRYPPSTTLLVRCVVNMPMLDDEWAYIASAVRKACSSVPFREVILIEPISDQFTTVHLRRLTNRPRPQRPLQRTSQVERDGKSPAPRSASRVVAAKGSRT